MKLRRTTIAATAVVAAVGLAACGGSGGSSGGSGGAFKIGIKFDQPGMGLKEGAKYTGFDVDVARYVAHQLGHKDSDIQFVEAPTPQRETLISTGQVNYIVGTYSITPERKQKVSFAGPYFIAGQDLLVRSDETAITGPDTLTGKKLCSVKGSTSAAKVKDKYPGVQLQEYDTYSKCVEALNAKVVDALTTDNTILAGYASQPAYKGKLKLVGKTFSEEKYGIGLKKGDTALCTKITDAIKKMVADGSWQNFVQTNLGPAGFKPGAGNPPTPEPCS
jgi:glutamate transport system substrate-binding protein